MTDINKRLKNAIVIDKDVVVVSVADLQEENTKLKELLKECREHLITYKRDDLDKGYVVYDGSYLIDKINQVLGEE